MHTDIFDSVAIIFIPYQRGVLLDFASILISIFFASKKSSYLILSYLIFPSSKCSQCHLPLELVSCLYFEKKWPLWCTSWTAATTVTNLRKFVFPIKR